MMKPQLYYKQVVVMVIAGLVLVACASAATPTTQATQATPTPIVVEVTRIVAGTPQVETMVVTATPQPTAPPQPTATSQPVKLVFWSFGPENEKRPELGGKTWEEFFQGVFAAFSKEYPNITFDFKQVGYAAGGTTLYLDTALAAGDPPDIMRDAGQRMVKYAGEGLLVNLSDVVAGHEGEFSQGVLGQVTNGSTGELWGIPHGTTPYFMMINKTLFSDAGCLDKVPPPTGDREWTTDQFMAAIKCVNNPAKKVFGTMLWSKTPSGDYLNFPYLLGFGAKFFPSPNNCQATIINSAAGIQGLQFTMDLVNGHYTVPGPAGLTDDDQWAYWQRKELALIGAYPYHKTLAALAITQGLAKAPFDVYYVNFPHAPGAPNTPIIVGPPQVFSIFKVAGRDPARVQAAKTFLSWLVVHNDYIKQWALAMGLPITGYTAHGNLYPDDTDIAWVLQASQRDGGADIGYGCGKYPAIRNLWTQAMQKAWSGGAKAQAVLDDYVKKANAVLQSP